jgi:FAD-dependent urate hydroxylase
MVTPAQFRGRRVAVVGRGQSAVESAVLLNEAGAEVDLICRGAVRWLGEEAVRPRAAGNLMWHLRNALHAPSGIGPFPYSWFADMPSVLYRLTPRSRKRLTALCLRPAASGWLQPRARGIRIDAGRTLSAAAEKHGRLILHLDSGASDYDHVVLSTGYQININRLGVIAPEMLRRVKQSGGCPVLSPAFETSVPGLHFVGCSAVGSFGPLPRFVAGCGFAARRVTEAAFNSKTRPSRRSVPRRMIASQSRARL